MSDIHSALPAVKRDFTGWDNSPGEFCWGAAEIGAVIGRNPRQTHHLLTNGQIACARKVGGRWVASRSALLREFGA
jgi:hypothetical protein